MAILKQAKKIKIDDELDVIYYDDGIEHLEMRILDKGDDWKELGIGWGLGDMIVSEEYEDDTLKLLVRPNNEDRIEILSLERLKIPRKVKNIEIYDED